MELLLLLNLTNEIYFKGSDKYIALSNLNIYYAWKNIKKSCKSNKCKLSVPTLNDKFKLHNGSYSVSGIQDYIQYIIKKCETLTNDPLISLYLKKIENRTTFKLKTGCYF